MADRPETAPESSPGIETNPVYRQQISSAIKCLDGGELERAADACGAALEQDPGRHEAYFLLAATAFLVQDLGRAIEMAQKGHDLDPDCAEGCDMLAHLHAYAGNLNDSVYFGKLAAAGNVCPVLSSLRVTGLDNLAQAMDEARGVSYQPDALRAFFEENYDHCISICEKEMRLNKGDMALFQFYGRALIQQGEVSRGLAALHGALHMDSDNGESYVRLGEGYVLRGDQEMARMCFDHALVLLKDQATNRAAALATISQYRGLMSAPWPSFDNAVRKWAKQVFGARTKTGATGDGSGRSERSGGSGRSERDEQENIRVGMLVDRACSSEELRYLEPWFWQIDRNLIDLFVYSADRPGDSAPTKLKGLTHGWIDTADINEGTLMATINAHNLDVLVDVRVRELGQQTGLIAGLWAQNTIPHIIRWNAPGLGVRASGYDAVVCDEGVKTSGKDGPWTIVSTAARPVLSRDGLAGISGMSPVQTLGHVTFGATCDLSRVTPHVVMVWSQILHALPGSRLLLGNTGHIPADVKSRFQEMFSCFGCVGRVGFAPLTSTAPEVLLVSRLEFLVAADVYLDSFPNGGGIELADPLWSGLPVIAHTAHEQPGSTGNAVIRAAGQDQWLARTDKAYIKCAVKAAEAVREAADWRSTMHEAVKNSALFDQDAWGKELNALLVKLADK